MNTRLSTFARGPGTPTKIKLHRWMGMAVLLGGAALPVASAHAEGVPEFFEGCGTLRLGPTNCLTFVTDDEDLALLRNGGWGTFTEGDRVFVSGQIDSCGITICAAHGCLTESSIVLLCSPSIPAVSEWGVMLLGLLVLCAGVIVLRRKERTHHPTFAFSNTRAREMNVYETTGARTVGQAPIAKFIRWIAVTTFAFGAMFNGAVVLAESGDFFEGCGRLVTVPPEKGCLFFSPDQEEPPRLFGRVGGWDGFQKGDHVFASGSITPCGSVCLVDFDGCFVETSTLRVCPPVPVISTGATLALGLSFLVCGSVLLRRRLLRRTAHI